MSRGGACTASSQKRKPEILINESAQYLITHGDRQGAVADGVVGGRVAEWGRPLPWWVRERWVGYQQRELTLPTSLPVSRPPQM